MTPSSVISDCVIPCSKFPRTVEFEFSNKLAFSIASLQKKKLQFSSVFNKELFLFYHVKNFKNMQTKLKSLVQDKSFINILVQDN